MNYTNQLGEITELRCRLDFVQRGIVLSQPTNPSSRYDFIADLGNKLIKIQCKTCHLESNNRIGFSISSKNWNSGERHNYIGEIDYFYTNWKNQGYLIPIECCSEKAKERTIRLGDPDSYSSNNINAIYGFDLTIDKVLKTLNPNLDYEVIDIESDNREKAREGKTKNICKQCGALVSQGRDLCWDCYKKTVHPADIPDREELKTMIRTMPFTKIGEHFHRTDNAIRKWCDSYNLPRTKKEINSINDNDWINI